MQLHDERSVIGKNLFKKETNIQPFIGLKVKLSTGILYTHIHLMMGGDCICIGEIGVIESSFGTSGKFRVHIQGANIVISVCNYMCIICYNDYSRADGGNTTITINF